MICMRKSRLHFPLRSPGNIGMIIRATEPAEPYKPIIMPCGRVPSVLENAEVTTAVARGQPMLQMRTSATINHEISIRVSSVCVAGVIAAMIALPAMRAACANNKSSISGTRWRRCNAAYVMSPRNPIPRKKSEVSLMISSDAMGTLVAIIYIGTLTVSKIDRMPRATKFCARKTNTPTITSRSDIGSTISSVAGSSVERS